MSDSPSEEEGQVGEKELERDSAMELGDPLEAEESVLIQFEDSVEDEARAVRFDVPEKEEDGDGDLSGAHDDAHAGLPANEINKGPQVSLNLTKSDQRMGESSASSSPFKPLCVGLIVVASCCCPSHHRCTEPPAKPYEGLNRGQLLGRLLEAVRRCEVLEIENSNLHAYHALKEKAVGSAEDAQGQGKPTSVSGRAIQRMMQKDRARFELVAQQEVINADLQAENVRLREQLQLRDLIGGRSKD